MKIRIYDYDDNAVKIEIPDKPIECIDVTVLSGDETGTIQFEDGTQLDFDASCDRYESYDEVKRMIEEATK